MAQHAPPPPMRPTRSAPRKPPPSWWWFAAPVVLTVAAVLVGVGALVSTVQELTDEYGEVRTDGEPHAVVVPVDERAMVMLPDEATDVSCRVTDDAGESVPTQDTSGDLSVSNDGDGWESSISFAGSDLGEARDGRATAYVACTRPTSGAVGEVLVVKAPEVASLVGRVLLMVLGPLALGGAAFVWFVVLVVLQVTRRSAA